MPFRAETARGYVGGIVSSYAQDLARRGGARLVLTTREPLDGQSARSRALSRQVAVSAQSLAGRDPSVAARLALSAYRIAYARWRGLDPARVRGAFFHAATGETTRPRLLDEDEVVRLLGEVVA